MAEKLTTFLKKLERQELRLSGLYKKPGGFVKAKVVSYENNAINIKIEYGFEHNYNEPTFIENIKIDKKTFEII